MASVGAHFNLVLSLSAIEDLKNQKIPQDEVVTFRIGSRVEVMSEEFCSEFRTFNRFRRKKPKDAFEAKKVSPILWQ